MNAILNLADVAALLQVHPNTVRKLVRTGVIPAAKINKAWMFVGDDVVQAIRNRYATEAQSTRSGMESSTRPSTNEVKHGGSVLPRQAEKSLDDLLARKTKGKQRSTTTG